MTEQELEALECRIAELQGWTTRVTDILDYGKQKTGTMTWWVDQFGQERIRPPRVAREATASHELVTYMVTTRECEYALNAEWLGIRVVWRAAFETHRGAFMGKGWEENDEDRLIAIAKAALGSLEQQKEQAK